MVFAKPRPAQLKIEGFFHVFFVFRFCWLDQDEVGREVLRRGREKRFDHLDRRTGGRSAGWQEWVDFVYIGISSNYILKAWDPQRRTDRLVGRYTTGQTHSILRSSQHHSTRYLSCCISNQKLSDRLKIWDGVRLLFKLLSLQLSLMISRGDERTGVILQKKENLSFSFVYEEVKQDKINILSAMPRKVLGQKSLSKSIILLQVFFLWLRGVPGVGYFIPINNTFE